MNQRELEDIEQFLASVHQVSLYNWVGASPDSTPEEVEAALKRKRSWAQGHQASQKHREEAQWVLRNYTRLVKVLVVEADAWRLYVHEALVARAIESLVELARGHVLGGTLAEADEQMIMDRARSLDLDADVVRWRIEESIREMGANRESADERATEIPVVPPSDLYERLGVDPGASVDALEQAYLDRTRWAASLQSSEQVSIQLHAIEEAWDTLSNPERRYVYDQTRDQLKQTAQEAAHREALLSAVRQAQPAVPVLGSSGRRLQPPAIAIEGGNAMQLRVADAPVRSTLVVRNDGRGRMPGMVRSDVPWLRVPRGQLDPNAGRQGIAFEVDTPQLSWGQNRAQIIVDGDHGQQVMVQVVVHRFPWARMVRNGLVAGTWLTAVLMLGGGALDYRASRSPGTVKLRIDPAADHVTVDGKHLGSGKEFLLEPEGPDKPMEVVVSTAGFADHVERLQARRASKSERTLRLDLTDPMDFEPPKDEPAVDPTKWQAALEAAGPEFSACLPSGGRANARAWVTREGEVRRLELEQPDFDADSARPCLLRTARALRLPPDAGWSAVRWDLRVEASR
jgi:hypothetical protein